MRVLDAIRARTGRLRRLGGSFLFPRKSGVISIHAIDRSNIGDIASSPFNYFETTTPVYPMNFWDLDAGSTPPEKTFPVILGGGGLYYSPTAIERLVINHSGPVIAWGIGRNGKLDDDHLGYLGSERFALFGVRDWDVGHYWVPCVSCASPLFDLHQGDRPAHSVVVYEHKDVPIDLEGLPRMRNNVRDMEEVIRFLASGETVITNSYHGVYWAQLLGRKVLAMPISNRFTAFRFQPILTTKEGWRSDLKRATGHAGALDACRARTLEFAERVEDLLGIELKRKPAA